MLIRLPEEIEDFLKRERHSFDTPQCYLGTEVNTHKKSWDDPAIKLRILFVSCSRYEDFRGNQTIPLIYQMLNERDDILCDRAFFPNTEREYKLFCKYKIPIFGLETKQSMSKYDIILTSLSFVPPWINLILMLEMSGIPSFWKERDDSYPLIMVGGSAVYGNFALVHPVVDIIYLGDAEPGLLPLLDRIKQGKGLYALQKEFEYILTPKHYTPAYDGQNFKKWAITKGCPTELKIIRQKDLNDAFALTKPILSFMDTTMGLGEVEVSRGCRAHCIFCGIGWKYRPYRERSRKKMVELLLENRKNSGAISLCPIATEFAYYSEKQGLIHDLMQKAHAVDPLSMRVDAFVDDPEFDAQLAERGMNQVALGVEAPSQRLRNRLMKGITEEQILRACDIALRRGFRRIKFFMISNIDERWEDFEEFFNLLSKVRKMQVPFKGKKGRLGWNIQITASWTPWFIEPCTPAQWKKPTIEQRQEWKKIDEILRGELKCKFKLGIKNAEDFLWTMQGMHLGDTRFAEALVYATLRLHRPFYVAFTKKMKTQLTEEFKRVGYSWDFIMRERGGEENFIWDIVDRGVKKETLRKIYNKVVSGEQDLIEMKIPVPTDHSKVSYSKGHHSEIEPVNWFLVKYRVSEEFEVVPNTYIKAFIHQGAFQIDHPIVVNSVKFFSDREARNWYGGVDHFVFSSRDDNILGMCERLSFIEVYRFLGREGTFKIHWKRLINEFAVEGDISGLSVKSYYESLQNSSEVIVAIPST